jgi:hypothetical protein
MRTVSGVLGLSAIYHTRTHEDWVVFYDYESGKMNIRRGGPNFYEYPDKYEVSVGLPSKVSNATTNSSGDYTGINLEQDEDRTKNITFDIPHGDNIMFFRLGDTSNYYGTFICGDGEMRLRGLEVTGIEQNPENYKFDDEIVSPVYEYMKGPHAQYTRKDLRISVATTDGPIIVDNGDTNVENVTIQYVKDNQTIENAERFDIVQMGDHEMIVTMGRPFRSFTVVNPDDDTVGSTDRSNGIYLIGSKDTGNLWGAPIANRLNFGGNSQYGMLVLNDVKYCCSQYNPRNNELIIFMVGFFANEVYFGAFIMNANTLDYQTFLCTPSDGEQPFLWRPPAIEDDKINHSEDLVQDGYTFDPEEYQFRDEIIKIASVSSEVGASAVVDNVTDFGVVSSMILGDGTYVLFYDGLEGIKMLWSNSTGRNWRSSEIILARNAQSAIWVSGLLIYIVEETGIMSKIVTRTLLNSAMFASAGSSSEDIEIIQEEFDNQITASLKTGPVPPQKLAGHRDTTGINHIFYYNEDRKLCSSQGTDVEWSVTENF